MLNLNTYILYTGVNTASEYWEGGQVVILPMLAGERGSFLHVVKVDTSLLLSEVRSDGGVHCSVYSVHCYCLSHLSSTEAEFMNVQFR